jgi:hypothetical protein
VIDVHQDTRELLAGLPDRDVPALLHLLSCDDCTLNAVQSLTHDVEYGLAGEGEMSSEEAFQRLEETRPGLLRALEERRRHAQALLEALLELPAGERMRAVAREERFQERSLVRFYWAEGRVAARAGRPREALDLLLATRRKLLSLGRLHDAALATLDVALVLAEDRQPGEIHPLIHELLARFPSDAATAGVLVALAAFETVALEGREDLRKARALAAAYVQRMSRSGPHSTES